MRTIVAAGLAVLLAGAAGAQPPAGGVKPPPKADMWVFVRFADGAMAWNLEAGRWFDNNDMVEGQRLVYYADPQVVDGLKIVWAQEFWRIRCKANTYQVKSGEELTAGLGTAFTLSQGEPFAISDNSPEWILKRTYCDNVDVGGAQHAEGIIEVMDAMKAPAR